MARECHGQGVAVAVFPELGLSGYAISDLLQQDALLDAVETAAARVIAESRALMPLLLVGAPLRHLGVSTIARWRSIAAGCWAWCRRSTCRTTGSSTSRAISSAATGWRNAEIVVRHLGAVRHRSAVRRRRLPGLIVHAEICEDVWVPIPPSGEAALAGATVLANLSASNITIGKAETRRLLCHSQSARCLAAYLYAAAGAGKSTTDLAWDGQASVFENGVILAETERFPDGDQHAIADIDLDLLRQERLQMGSFDTNRRRHANGPVPHALAFRVDPPAGDVGFRRRVERFPFVPADRRGWSRIATRPTTSRFPAWRSGCAPPAYKRVVIGVSGGLDSTQALIVCAQAFDLLGLPRNGYPGLHHAGVRHLRSDQIQCLAPDAVAGRDREGTRHPPGREADAGRSGPPLRARRTVYDITFENVQAGLRTDYLFRLANHHDGIVIGTGDLSELALGWCTYGVGDQMAHYNVNAGVPKTLIQHLIRWVIASEQFAREVPETLDAILATEISPELIPAAEGETPQSTEAKIGPYALQDFTLFYTLRYGFRPSKIAFMALQAWEDPERGRLAARLSADRAALRIRPDADPPLAGAFPAPLLRVQPVQAHGDAEWPESDRRRIAVAARRLARAVGRQCPRMAGRVGRERARKLKQRKPDATT